ncbi:hypothetical protein MPSEU_001084000 [Mayamaea pseudoterrestris]|nr:hypothetical protein MPSEU_001084000 [Mayamaea pseudoterrestris]
MEKLLEALTSPTANAASGAPTNAAAAAAAAVDVAALVEAAAPPAAASSAASNENQEGADTTPKKETAESNEANEAPTAPTEHNNAVTDSEDKEGAVVDTLNAVEPPVASAFASAIESEQPKATDDEAESKEQDKMGDAEKGDEKLAEAEVLKVDDEDDRKMPAAAVYADAKMEVEPASEPVQEENDKPAADDCDRKMPVADVNGDETMQAESEGIANVAVQEEMQMVRIKGKVARKTMMSNKKEEAARSARIKATPRKSAGSSLSSSSPFNLAAAAKQAEKASSTGTKQSSPKAVTASSKKRAAKAETTSSKKRAAPVAKTASAAAAKKPRKDLAASAADAGDEPPYLPLHGLIDPKKPDKWPTGWTVQHRPRKSDPSRLDPYYQSPKGHRFRSKSGVRAFLAKLKELGPGQEDAAYKIVGAK